MQQSEPTAAAEATRSAQAAALARAERAYQVGDFAAVRALTKDLLTAHDAELGRRASALRARVSVDPVALIVLAFALLLFCAIVVIYAL